MGDTDAELAAAWDELHAAIPAGWFVGRPAYEDRYNVGWSMYAFDTAEHPRPGRPRQREWTTIAPTEADCVRNMAYSLR